MNAAAWWRSALVGGEAVGAWHRLPPEERSLVRQALKKARGESDPVLRSIGTKLSDAVLVAELPGSHPPLSNHLRLEIASAVHRGRPLAPGEPVPGCGCSICTGIPENHPSRVPAWRRRDPKGARERDHQRRQEWDRRVDDARRVPILAVARLLGLGETEGSGREVSVRCPLHADERPSLRLNTEKDLWYCHVCAVGGDGIALVMKARGLDFVDAVKEMGT